MSSQVPGKKLEITACIIEEMNKLEDNLHRLEKYMHDMERNTHELVDSDDNNIGLLKRYKLVENTDSELAVNRRNEGLVEKTVRGHSKVSGITNTKAVPMVRDAKMTFPGPVSGNNKGTFRDSKAKDMKIFHDPKARVVKDDVVTTDVKVACHDPITKDAKVAFHDPIARDSKLAFHNPIAKHVKLAFHDPISRDNKVAFHDPIARTVKVAFHNPISKDAEVTFHDPIARNVKVAFHDPISRDTKMTFHNPTARGAKLAFHNPIAKDAKLAFHDPNAKLAFHGHSHHNHAHHHMSSNYQRHSYNRNQIHYRIHKARGLRNSNAMNRKAPASNHHVPHLKLKIHEPHGKDNATKSS